MKMQNRKFLNTTLEACFIEDRDSIIDKLDRYQEMVLEWNKKINLTSITQEDDFVLKHFVDSLLCCHFKGMKEAKLIADVGTGAGFPGIPLAITYPDKEFHLIDSLKKRLGFLQEVVDELKLKNIVLIHGRAEDIGKDEKYREKYDLVLSRAVARLNVLSEYCLPLVKLNGTFAALKSNDAEEEAHESRKAMNLLGGELEHLQEDLSDGKLLNHMIIYTKKVKNTPKKYPRKAGEPTKTPII
ncbi:MAG: 16S rRNA (guanine(527)-N(7))-methyltransferase RsmG [Peptostreptococcales bacterium]